MRIFVKALDDNNTKDMTKPLVHNIFDLVHFLNLANKVKFHKSIRIDKLQSLLYFLQGTSLAVYNRKIFDDDIAYMGGYCPCRVVSVNEAYRGYFHVTELSKQLIQSIFGENSSGSRYLNKVNTTKSTKQFITRVAKRICYPNGDYDDLGKIANIVNVIFKKLGSYRSHELQDIIISYDSPFKNAIGGDVPYLTAIRDWFKRIVVITNKSAQHTFLATQSLLAVDSPDIPSKKNHNKH